MTAELLSGAPRDSTSRHRFDTSSRRDAGSAGADFRTTRDPAASGRLLVESFSGRLLTQVFELCATRLHNRSVARLILNVPKAIAGLEFAFLRRR